MEKIKERDERTLQWIIRPLNKHFNNLLIPDKGITWGVPFRSESSPPIIFTNLPVYQMIDITTPNHSNSTPKINENTPSMWIVTYGCNSFLDLMPTDKDGDIFKCRFRQNPSEAWYPGLVWPSLTVDPDTCRVTYTGSRDKTEIGDLNSAYKLIDLILEDVDTNGNVRIGLIRSLRCFSV